MIFTNNQNPTRSGHPLEMVQKRMHNKLKWNMTNTMDSADLEVGNHLEGHFAIFENLKLSATNMETFSVYKY